MLLVIPGIIILIYSLHNFKRALMYFIIYEMIWYPSAEVIRLGSDRSLTIGFLMTLFLTLNFLFLRNGISKIRKKEFPFFRPFAFLIFSYFLTTFFSYAGFASEIFRALIILFQSYMIVVVIWHTITDKKDYNRLFGSLAIVYIISCLYGLVEYILKKNPLAEYKSGLSSTGIEFYDVNRVRGYRLMATFEHPIAAGMMFALLLIFVVVCIGFYQEKIKNKPLFVIGAFLSIICILLTKMRAGLVFVFIGVLSVVDFKKKGFIKILIASLVGAILISPILYENINIVLSVFNKNAQEQVGGSSVEQRLSQLQAVLNLLKLSPIAGLGEKFQQYLVNYDTVMALGYESVWLEQTAKHGIVGILANIYFAYYSIIKIPRKYNSKPAFFLALSFWVTYSMTIVTSFRMDLYYLVYFYFLKMSSGFAHRRINSKKRNNGLTDLLQK